MYRKIYNTKWDWDCRKTLVWKKNEIILLIIMKVILWKILFHCQNSVFSLHGKLTIKVTLFQLDQWKYWNIREMKLNWMKVRNNEVHRLWERIHFVWKNINKCKSRQISSKSKQRGRLQKHRTTIVLLLLTEKMQPSYLTTMLTRS